MHRYECMCVYIYAYVCVCLCAGVRRGTVHVAGGEGFLPPPAHSSPSSRSPPAPLSGFMRKQQRQQQKTETVNSRPNPRPNDSLVFVRVCVCVSLSVHNLFLVFVRSYADSNKNPVVSTRAQDHTDASLSLARPMRRVTSTPAAHAEPQKRARPHTRTHEYTYTQM